MAKEIWNEGRVVGYSAYDIYVKQHLASQPDGTPPASESEWLSASLASGNSLLAKIPNVNDAGITDSAHSYVDFVLPVDSRLGAANTIVASFFDGDAHFPSDSINTGIQYKINGTNKGNSNIWADKVIDYGELIQNDNTASPSTDGNTIPVKQLVNWTAAKKQKLTDYMKIVDGIVIQPGEWSDTESGSPKKDEFQNLSDRPTIRLHIRGRISSNPLVLFTGFTIRSVLSGTSILGSATNTEVREDESGYLGHVAPEDGDFLGPSLYPWANKIIFSVPSSFIAYFESGKYERNIPIDADNKMISDTPTIDMNKGPNQEADGNTAIDPYWFYSSANSSGASTKLPAGFRDNIVRYNVVDFTTLGDGTAVLTVYEKKRAYPPALYGTFVKADGDNYLCPLDCVAPGTVKMFVDDDGTVMNDYENTFPGTVSMNKDSSTGEISTLVTVDGEKTKRPIASVNTETFGNSLATVVKVGNRTVKSLAVSPLGTNDTDPTIYSTTGTSGSIEPANGKFHWNHLTDALKNNKLIDILKNGLTGGTGISISGDGPYTITNTKPYDLDTLRKDIDSAIEVTAGPGIAVQKTKASADSKTVYKVSNTKPYDPAGINYHYITMFDKINNNEVFNIQFQNGFRGFLGGSSRGVNSGSSSLIYRGLIPGNGTSTTISNHTYSLDGNSFGWNHFVRLGFNGDNMVKNADGTYSGVMYFHLDFGVQIPCKVTNDGKDIDDGSKVTATRNINNTLPSGSGWAWRNTVLGNPTMTSFKFSHSHTDSATIKEAAVLTLQFKNAVSGLWGNMNELEATHRQLSNSNIWNMYFVFRKPAGSGKFYVRKPQASAEPVFIMRAVNYHSGSADRGNLIWLNPWRSEKKFALTISSYNDGYNDQFSDWDDRCTALYGYGGHMYSHHLNFGPSWAVNVQNVKLDQLKSL